MTQPIAIITLLCVIIFTVTAMDPELHRNWRTRWILGLCGVALGCAVIWLWWCL